MRVLNRNKQEFDYRILTKDVVPVLDPDGFETGEYAPVYSDKITARASITPATGTVNERAFGENIEYDRIICAETDFGMDEHSQLWVDDRTSSEPDYVVKRISRSLNHVRIAIARVDLNERHS